MNNIKLYCITSGECATVRNEKAPISRRGLVGVSWGTRDRFTDNTSILTLHVKVRNTFMEFYV